MMYHIIGDLFNKRFMVEAQLKQNNHISSAIVHVCNDEGYWGRGFVVPLANHFPEAKREYLNWANGNDGIFAEHDSIPFEVGQYQPVIVNANEVIYNVIGQNGIRSNANPYPIDYHGLKRALSDIAEGDMNDPFEVFYHMPRIGCGLAGGDWNTVKVILEETLCKIGNVCVYTLPNEVDKFPEVDYLQLKQ